jgi:hypothetical protein
MEQPQDEHVTAGPYRVPLSQVSKRTRLGGFAHAAKEYGWDTYVYESKYYSGDTQLKNGNIRKGKEGTYTWLVAKIMIDNKWYVVKYSELANKINGRWFDIDTIRGFITRKIGPENIF